MIELLQTQTIKGKGQVRGYQTKEGDLTATEESLMVAHGFAKYVEPSTAPVLSGPKEYKSQKGDKS